MNLSGIEYSCRLEAELIEKPENEILIKAKLQMCKRKLFLYIQELQTKDLQGRKPIYELIRKLDQ